MYDTYLVNSIKTVGFRDPIKEMVYTQTVKKRSEGVAKTFYKMSEIYFNVWFYLIIEHYFRMNLAE